MTDPTGKNGVKTLGIKLPPSLHSQFALVAQLDGINLSVAVLRAVEFYVAHKRSEPDFNQRATKALAEIEEEAAARRAAIEGLFGDVSPKQDVTAAPATDDSATAETTKLSRARRAPDKE